MTVPSAADGAPEEEITARDGVAFDGAREENGASAADGGHGPVRLKEGRVVDPVPRQLRRDRGLPLGGKLVVGRPGPQRRPQVALRPGEQAVADLPVGGEAHPVAGAAERLGNRGDHPDPGRAAVDEERLGGGGAPGRFGYFLY